MIFNKKTPMGDIENNMAYTTHISRLEQRDMEHAFTRVFNTEDGKKVLAWLQVMTFHRVAGSQTTNDQLRYMEGQRALVASILRMIDRGKNN